MKKVIIFIIALTFFSCSKENIETDPITIVDSSWVNGHEETIPENRSSDQYPIDTMGWAYEMIVTLRNNTNKEISGTVFFYMNEWSTGSIEINVIPANETKTFTQKVWQLGKGSYVTGYNDLRFELK